MIRITQLIHERVQEIPIENVEAYIVKKQGFYFAAIDLLLTQCATDIAFRYDTSKRLAGDYKTTLLYVVKDSPVAKAIASHIGQQDSEPVSKPTICVYHLEGHLTAAEITRIIAD